MKLCLSPQWTETPQARMIQRVITEHSEDFFHPNSGFVINSVRNAPLMITSIIANTLVLTAILGMPMLRSPSLTLLCSQAVSEFLVGIVVQPLYIVN